MDRVRLLLFCLCVTYSGIAKGASKEIERLNTLPPESPPSLTQFELIQMRMGIFGTPEQCAEYVWWSCKRCIGL